VAIVCGGHRVQVTIALLLNLFGRDQGSGDFVIESRLAQALAGCRSGCSVAMAKPIMGWADAILLIWSEAAMIMHRVAKTIENFIFRNVMTGAECLLLGFGCVL
jgi:hypothetical protein